MDFTREVFDLSGKTDQQLADLFARHLIGLTPDEGRKLQEQILRRPPSLAELTLFSIEGSEHCSYKSSRPYLDRFVTDGEDVILGAKEDAGVVRVARDNSGTGYCVVMSHESHNHPSQVVPYEGAATGVGGNVRDVCCMGAEVIALADDLRFGTLDSPKTRRLFEEVVSGIAGYGNPIGVPSIAGGVQFDPGYQDNCLVTVVTLGILREDRIIHSYAPENSDGYDLILTGKPTDNSGFGGASFASFELEEEKHEQNKGAVQEPNAFLGRHMIQSSISLFRKLADMDMLSRVGFKDLGAGGIACASVELADEGGCGAVVNLDLVHTSMEGLAPHVVLCAETQERYMWVSPPELTQLILDHYNREFALPEVSRGACARVIGRITREPRYVVTSGDITIVDAPAPEVTRGFLYHRETSQIQIPQDRELILDEPKDYGEMLLSLLSHENIASRHRIFDSYDKQVQGRTAVEAGRSDAGILCPFNSHEYPEEIRSCGITLTTDQNPRINRHDPSLGAAMAVIEAVTNTAASGARPAALTDCLCYGNPEKPDQMAQFAAGCTAAADTARALGIPIIAGNVSLYNESKGRSIPPSPMIACLGVLDDASLALEQHFCSPSSQIFLLSCGEPGIRGSVYAEITGETGGSLPTCNLDFLQRCMVVIREAAALRSALSCHDLSEGGLAVALCEMTFAGGLGCTVDIPGSLRNDIRLFGEAPGFLVEGDEQFMDLCVYHGVQALRIGSTTPEPRIKIGTCIDEGTEPLRQAWYEGLERRLQ